MKKIIFILIFNIFFLITNFKLAYAKQVDCNNLDKKDKNYERNFKSCLDLYEDDLKKIKNVKWSWSYNRDYKYIKLIMYSPEVFQTCSLDLLDRNGKIIRSYALKEIWASKQDIEYKIDVPSLNSFINEVQKARLLPCHSIIGFIEDEENFSKNVIKKIIGK